MEGEGELELMGVSIGCAGRHAMVLYTRLSRRFGFCRRRRLSGALLGQ